MKLCGQSNPINRTLSQQQQLTYHFYPSIPRQLLLPNERMTSSVCAVLVLTGWQCRVQSIYIDRHTTKATSVMSGDSKQLPQHMTTSVNMSEVQGIATCVHPFTFS